MTGGGGGGGFLWHAFGVDGGENVQRGMATDSKMGMGGWAEGGRHTLADTHGQTAS